MENLQIDELKLIKKGLILFADQKDLDGNPPILNEEYLKLLEKVNVAIMEDENLTDDKRRSEAEDAIRSEQENQTDDF